jgi:hypothetical protein
MKKKSGKAQSLRSAQEKAEHRNVQMPRLRKGSVHPLPEQPPESAVQIPRNPQPKPGKKKPKRKPYKLHDATFKRLIGSIDAHCDAPMYVHLHAAGIHHDTFNEWKRLAAENPDGLHAFYLERVEKALARAWGRLHAAAVRHRASEVLFRMHPEAYPSERRRLELTGAEGLPLVPLDTFTVLIELASPQPDVEHEFVIEDQGGPNDGRRQIWQPNGQKPPS